MSVPVLMRGHWSGRNRQGGLRYTKLPVITVAIQACKGDSNMEDSTAVLLYYMHKKAVPEGRSLKLKPAWEKVHSGQRGHFSSP